MVAVTEAQEDGPAPARPRAGEAPTQVEPSAAPEKRAPAEREEDEDGDEGEEPRPEPKRRRAHVAALESVPRAAKVAAAAVDAAKVGTVSTDDGSVGGCDGEGFTFHVRSFSGVETTPKFGSFNPGAAEFADSAATAVAGGGEEDTAEGSDGSSR